MKTFNNLQKIKAMKTKLMFVAVMMSLTTFAFAGCESSAAAISSENRMINENFFGLILQTDARVILSQGEETSVRIDGDPKSVSSIQTTIENGALVIKSNSEAFVTIYVTVNDINLIEVDGNGKISGNQLINSDMLLLKVVGAGTINLDVRALSLGMIVKGNGKIYAKGSTGDSYVRVVGNGKVISMNLDTLRTSIEPNTESAMVKKNVLNSGKHPVLKLHQ
jgi:uncharacterized protein YpmS